MKILVTGATGNVGGEVVRHLRQRGVEVRAMARKPESVSFPAGVEIVPGDLTDPESIRAAAKGVDKLFLLNAVVADELTQALTPTESQGGQGSPTLPTCRFIRLTDSAMFPTSPQSSPLRMPSGNSACNIRSSAPPTSSRTI